MRDYDIFSAVNGKVFLSAPQRHHAGVVEGIMKAGQIRSWWENPAGPGDGGDSDLSPVHSLAIHSDALWGLAGTNVSKLLFPNSNPRDSLCYLQTGHVNLFTVRHEPGRHITSLTGHRGPVSALSLQHDEKGFFSAGWDGDALVFASLSFLLNCAQCTDHTLFFLVLPLCPAMGPKHRSNRSSSHCTWSTASSTSSSTSCF